MEYYVHGLTEEKKRSCLISSQGYEGNDDDESALFHFYAKTKQKYNLSCILEYFVYIYP